MGWNAGGFGRMTFPSADALAHWRDAVPPADVLPPPPAELPDEHGVESSAGEWIAGWTARGAHRSARRTDTAVEVRFDVGQDAFRDEAWSLTRVLATAAAHGGRGRFVLLATAGAEGDFAFELVLDAERAVLRRLDAERAKTAYASDDYRVLEGDVVAAPKKRSKGARKAATSPEDPVARVARLLGDPWKEKLQGATWRGVEEALHTLRAQKRPDAIPALARWLDHPAADVCGTAADVLLAYDDPAALQALVDRCGTVLRHPTKPRSGPSGYQTRCVAACIKLHPTTAYDRLLPLCEGVRSDPALEDPWVQAIFLVLSYSLLASSWVREHGLVDVPKRDPRWLDLAYDLSELKGKSLALAGPALLRKADDPRALRAYARSVRAVGAPYVASYTSYLGIRGAPFLALAEDPELADVAPALRALAVQLG